MKTYMEKQHWIRMELINDMKGKKAKRKKRKNNSNRQHERKRKGCGESLAQKRQSFSREGPLRNTQSFQSIETWNCNHRFRLGKGWWYRSINQLINQSINHMLSSHSYSCPFAHVPGLPGAKAKHMMMDKPENLGWTSVDRSTKATLSTYNTQIHLSRLQKIYHFQSSKLRLATQSL